MMLDFILLYLCVGLFLFLYTMLFFTPKTVIEIVNAARYTISLDEIELKSISRFGLVLTLMRDYSLLWPAILIELVLKIFP